MRRGVVASEIMVKITKPGALLLFHADGRWHLHDATRGGRVLSGGEARYAPSYKFQKHQNTGQNWSTYSFTITKEKPKDMNVKESKRMDGVEMFVASPRVCRAA